jgi:D-lactate dehydrogenase
MPNVLVTSHQAFLTREALNQIALTTLENLRACFAGEALVNEVKAEIKE